MLNWNKILWESLGQTGNRKWRHFEKKWFLIIYLIISVSCIFFSEKWSNWNKNYIFVTSSSSSIKSCINKSEMCSIRILLFVHPTSTLLLRSCFTKFHVLRWYKRFQMFNVYCGLFIGSGTDTTFWFEDSAFFRDNEFHRRARSNS